MRNKTLKNSIITLREHREYAQFDYVETYTRYSLFVSSLFIY
jgi:hypothetical protein